jgi:acyl-CoA hydrolase
MQNYQLVLTEHLNHYGYLFGGALLKRVDESAYICASLDHPGKSFVTAGMEKVSNKKRVELGSILIFNVEKDKTGKTSVTYRVTASVASSLDGDCSEIFLTMVAFVCFVLIKTATNVPLNEFLMMALKPDIQIQLAHKTVTSL